MEAQPLLRLWHCWLFPSSLQVALKGLVLCMWTAPPKQHHASWFLECRVSATHPGDSWSEGTFPFQQRSPLEPHLVGELWLHPTSARQCGLGSQTLHWNHGPSARSHITSSHHLTPKQLPGGNNSTPPQPLAVFKPRTWRWKRCILVQPTPTSILGGVCL